MTEFQMGDAESTRHSLFTRRGEGTLIYLQGPGKCVLVFSVYGRGMDMESTSFDECRVNNKGKTKNPAPPVKLGWVCDSE